MDKYAYECKDEKDNKRMQTKRIFQTLIKPITILDPNPLYIYIEADCLVKKVGYLLIHAPRILGFRILGLRILNPRTEDP